MPRYSRRKILKALEDCRTEVDNNRRGRLLEDLAAYLFGKIPGVNRIDRSTWSRGHASELDLVIWQNRHNTGLYFLHPTIPIECKNETGPMPGPEVDWFISKLRRRGLPCGIIISLDGVAGSEPDRTCGYEAIFSARAESRHILVISRADIEGLNTTEDLINRLQEVYAELIMG